ncbi:DUF4369 domain-containing protein [Winogradskyella algicola]|uniref:DUF4369 domain-containing protein n=1 Tax=Winogradskyella algicola TaxID=2575815 RepID=UPI001108DDD1|nr:DUF4369 domain-containing protein [Winogradskyella algicola]
MRQLLIFIFFILALYSCTNDKDGYKIKGSATGLVDGSTIYLKTLNKDGRELIIDTAIVTKGKFNITGNISEPTIHFLSTSNSRGQLIFMLEDSDIKIDLNINNIYLSQVSGSKSNEDFLRFQAGMDSIRQESNNIVLAYRKYGLSNEQKKDSLHKLLEKSSLAMQDYPLIFIKRNPTSYFSLNLINLETNKLKVDLNGYYKAFENLSDDLKNTPKGIIVKKKLDSLISVREGSKL